MKLVNRKYIAAIINELQTKPLEAQGLSQLLLRLNLTNQDWEMLCSSPNPLYKKSVRVMIMYKEWWEAECEKILLVQNKKYYNYQLLKGLLETSNPEKYKQNKKTTKVNDNAYSLNDFTNESEVDFFKSKDN